MSAERDKKLARKARLWGTRVVKLLIVLICTGAALVIGYIFLMKLIANHMADTVSINPSRETRFPALTVCPTYQLAFDDGVLDRYGLTTTKYQAGDFYGNSSDRSDDAGHRIFCEATRDLADLVKSVTLDTEAADSDKKQIEIPLNNTAMEEHEYGKWITKYQNTYGRCHSLELSNAVSRLSVIKITIKTYMDTYIFLHYPGEYMAYRREQTRVYSKLGWMYFVTLDFSIAADSIKEDSNIPCHDYHGEETYDECAYEKLSLNISGSYGCTLPWLPPLDEDDESKGFCKGLSAATGSQKSDAVRTFETLQNKKLTSLCLPPCTLMNFKVGWPDESDDYDPAVGFTKLYVSNRVKSNTKVLAYTLLSMIADVGCYVGILLGVAAVDVAAIIERIIEKL